MRWLQGAVQPVLQVAHRDIRGSAVGVQGQLLDLLPAQVSLKHSHKASLCKAEGTVLLGFGSASLPRLGLSWW